MAVPTQPHPYKSIVCAVDFDESSLAALRHAARLAAASDATLHVLHVVPLIPGVDEIADSIGPGGDAPAEQRLREIAKRELAAVKYEIHTTVALPHSHIATRILAAAADLDADLIVMATHGRAGVAHFLLGSVAEAVVRRASCPVLTVRG
jgi:nucleotide-binding universal stress UspA family protein